MIEIIKGDLFTSEDEALCHCVSEDLAMGKGIALLFKQKYGNVQYLKSQNAKVGYFALLETEKKIFYLVSKKRYFDKPTYESLKHCLIEMMNYMLVYGIKSLSMPLIGCGLDKLEWNKVKDIIEDVFENKGIKINVYVL